MHFNSLSKDRLPEAMAVAEEYASKFKRKGIVGIVFLGALGRGYYDKTADLDIMIFKSKSTKLWCRKDYDFYYKGFEIDYGTENYEDNAKEEWDMSKRWAFSTAKIFYDPEGKIRRLLKRKVILKESEKRWIIIEGMSQSFWHYDYMYDGWIKRGDIASANYSLNLALIYFLKALFALNNEFVPDEKWVVFLSQTLKTLPKGFKRGLKEVMLAKELSAKDLKRRSRVLDGMWKQMLPLAEKKVGMKFEDFRQLV